MLKLKAYPGGKMKKSTFILGLSLSAILAIAGCANNTTNDQAVIDKLSTQLDRVTNTVSAVSVANIDEIAREDFGGNVGTISQLSRLSSSGQTASAIARNIENNRYQILRKAKAIKKSITGGELKLGNDNARAISELTTSMQKYTTELTRTKSDYRNTVRSMAKLSDPGTQFDAKLTRLSCCLESRDCYLNNILNTLNNVEGILNTAGNSNGETSDSQNGQNTTGQNAAGQNTNNQNSSSQKDWGNKTPEDYANEQNGTNNGYNSSGNNLNNSNNSNNNANNNANNSNNSGNSFGGNQNLIPFNYNDYCPDGNCYNGNANCPDGNCYNNYANCPDGNCYNNANCPDGNCYDYNLNCPNGNCYNGNIANTNAYGMNRGLFNPGRNTDTYGPGVTNIDTYRYTGNGYGNGFGNGYGFGYNNGFNGFNGNNMQGMRHFNGSNGINAILPSDASNDQEMPTSVIDETAIPVESSTENAEVKQEAKKPENAEKFKNESTKQESQVETNDIEKIVSSSKHAEDGATSIQPKKAQKLDIDTDAKVKSVEAKPSENAEASKDNETLKQPESASESQSDKVTENGTTLQGEEKAKGHTSVVNADINKDIEDLVK